MREEPATSAVTAAVVASSNNTIPQLRNRKHAHWMDDDNRIVYPENVQKENKNRDDCLPKASPFAGHEDSNGPHQFVNGRKINFKYISPQSINHNTTNLQSAFSTDTWTGQLLIQLSRIFNRNQHSRSPATFAGFLSLLLLTMSNYMLGPMRDAAALKVGVSYIPMLTLVSTILALASSVPVGWLFEAPNPERKWRGWRGRIGLTRGETQGTSLALFLRCFAVCLFGYAFSFKLMDLLRLGQVSGEHRYQSSSMNQKEEEDSFLVHELNQLLIWNENETFMAYIMKMTSFVLGKFGKAFYVMFFLVVHLMKLHSISLMWGVTSEAMEYEEQAEIRAMKRQRQSGSTAGGHAVEMEGEKVTGSDHTNVNTSGSKVGGKSR
jgi:hypothetical protein